MRQHVEATATMDFVPEMVEIKTSYEEGTLKNVKMHDGSSIQLHKLAKDWDPLNKLSAMNAIQNVKLKNEILTGLIYMNPDTVDLHKLIHTSDTPLNELKQNVLCPGSKMLAEVNASLR